MQLFIATWLTLLVDIAQIAGVVLIAVYVVKTVQIAKANQESAKAAQDAVQAALKSVKLSELTIAEMKAARDATTAPYVVLSFELQLQHDFVLIVMENIGQSAARDISVTFEPPLDIHLRPSQKDPWPEFITGTTHTLAPRQRLSAYVHSVRYLLNHQDLVRRYTATVSYYGGFSARERRDVYVLDINAFTGELSRRSESADIADNLRDLSIAVNGGAQILNGIRDGLYRAASRQLSHLDETTAALPPTPTLQAPTSATPATEAARPSNPEQIAQLAQLRDQDISSDQ